MTDAITARGHHQRGSLLTGWQRPSARERSLDSAGAPQRGGSASPPRPWSRGRLLVTPVYRQRIFLQKVLLTTREDLLAVARGPGLASLLVGVLVTLRDLLTEVVERRRRCRPSRAWLFNLLRHSTALPIAPQEDRPQEECESDTQAVEAASRLYSSARGPSAGCARAPRRLHPPSSPASPSLASRPRRAIPNPDRNGGRSSQLSRGGLLHACSHSVGAVV